MTVCPFCKKAVVNPNGGPCPSCGKVDPRGSQASPAAPTSAAHARDEWDELEIQHGASSQQPSSGGSAYSGGSMGGFGDDDDAGPGISLELDTPVRSQAPPVMSAPPPQQSLPPHSQQGSLPPASVRTSQSGGHAPFQDGAMPQPLPTRSGRPSSDPSMAYAHQQSTPNHLAPPSSSQVAVQQAQQGPSSMPYPGSPSSEISRSTSSERSRSTSGRPAATDAAMMIARYPAPPAQVWQTPAYAVRVILRQLELRQDIDALKKKRSPDVPLYERALQTHDGTKFAIGMAINVTLFLIATTLFFMPVIRRFTAD